MPPALYGGTERVIAALCDELVDAGHDVTLFGAGSSTTKARLVPFVTEPLRPRMSRQEMIDVAPHLHLQMLAEIYARADEFDVIHSHVDLLTLPFVASTHVPTLITLHGRLDTDSSQQVFPLYPTVPLVSISDAQRQPLAGVQLDWVATVPNGLPLDPYLAEPRALRIPIPSRSSGGSATRSGRIWRSRSPAAPAIVCGSPPRSTRSTSSTTNRRSNH